ncbi:MAG TPA: N-acetyltransferase family protein [Bacillota bacterium]|nr:N-acetyltransferase family protein [Bacillota bacterium]HPT88181.1 N-acetyltransferase family protein [Bacillota bacterium]
MGITKNIRLATEADAAALLEIYAPYIRNTAISFEYEVPSVADFRERIVKVLDQYPWLVCEIDQSIAGYAYANRHRERAAYGWAVDASIYIRPEYHRKKVGKALYIALFELLKYQGYYNVYAGITATNEKSLRFHETFHFKPIGMYHKVGYKFGQWYDVVWMEMTLAEHPAVPEQPKRIDDIKDMPLFETIISRALQVIPDESLLEGRKGLAG